MPTDYSKDPEFRKAVAAGVAEQLAEKEKASRKGKPWASTDDAEERIADRVVEKMLAALSEGEEEGEPKKGGLGNVLEGLFGTPGKATG